MSKTFTAPGTISKITTMADNTLRLQVDCQEMPADQEAIVLKARNKYGYFLYNESEITETDVEAIPDYKPTEKGDKSPAQRLRAVLYRLWEQTGKVDMYRQPCDSDTYYKQIMETLINQHKDKLE